MGSKSNIEISLDIAHLSFFGPTMMNVPRRLPMTMMMTQVHRRFYSNSASKVSNRVRMILKEDCANLGSRGMEVQVKAGYARNYLYPQRLAVYATENNVELYKQEQQRASDEEEDKKQVMSQIYSRLAKSKLVFHRKCTKEEETLYGSVTKQDIVSALDTQLGISMGISRILLSTPLKKIGDYRIKIYLGQEDLGPEDVSSPESATETTTERVAEKEGMSSLSLRILASRK